MDETSRLELRRLASNDLYVMSKGVVAYPDINPDTHGRYIRFIQSEKKLRRLGLMPRGHLKTSVEIADCVRLPTQDVEDTRILIAAETSTLSVKILEETKTHWETNELLRSLFPEIAPSKFSGPGVTWRADMAKLPGARHKDPTWQAIGVGGAVIGGHFTRIKADDLIGYEAARSPAAMEAAIRWNDNIESLLVNQHTDIIDWTGTRWGRHDLYNNLMEKYGDEIAVFTREAIEHGIVIFPQLHTMEEYERIQRISPEVWFAQYCNNPQAAGTADLPVEAVRHYQFSLDGNYVEGFDASNKPFRWAISQLDRVVLCDPNSGSKQAPDEAAIVVTGTSPDNNIFVLESWSGRPSPSEFVDEIIARCARWRPRAVGIEKAGQQTTLHYFEQKRFTTGFFLPMPVPLQPKNRDKVQRIRANLEPAIRSGRLFILASQTQLRSQIAQFPDLILFDQIDALGYGPELWRKPLDTGTVERTRGNLRLLLARRGVSKRTGY